METMRAVVRSSDPKKVVEVKTIPVPKMGADDVLVRVEATPINPSDEYFAKGVYGVRERMLIKGDVVPGFEGSGVVTKVGANVPKELLNQRVAFCTDPHDNPNWTGTWAQYVALNFHYCVPTGDLPFEDTCGFFVNPITAQAFLLEAKLRKSAGLVHTAAASSLGRMLVKLCQKKGVELINVVRRPEQEQALKDIGAKYILNQNDPEFVKKLSALTHKLNVTLCLDAVAGALTGKVLAGLPENGTVMVYGSLSMAPCSDVNPSDLLFYGKKLEGFWMKHSPLFAAPEQVKEASEFIIQDLKTGGHIFKSAVVRQIKLDQCAEFVDGYKKDATKGKTIICPNKA